jgi:4-amino-4-deoxy-L-arabinose transferase-like glycosyltransferase
MFKHFSQKHWLLILLLIALGFRLYRITNPIADWHSFRQADTASVTREYLKHGINVLVPRYQDLSNIQSGLDNLEGYRMVEFPLLNAITAAIIFVTGAPLVLTSRLVSVFFSLGTLLCLFFLVKRISNQHLAYVTAGIFAVLPYSVYYSRAVLPEASLLFWLCLSLWSFTYWLDTNSKRAYGVAVLSLAIAFLLKPFVVFLAPVYFMLALLAFKQKIFKQWLLFLFPVLAVLPFFWWRDWIQQFPSGIPASDWLFNSNHIRFRPAWFRWIFWERITLLMSSVIGVGMMLLNLTKINRDAWIYGSWWVGMLAYFSVIATGNVQHDYYQVLVVPILCISMARGMLLGFDFLVRKLNLIWAVSIIGSLCLMCWVLAWNQVAGFYNVNHWEYIEAGQAADRLFPADAKVIAPAFGDTHFLFQTNRTGWPIGFEIEQKIQKGATHYVTTSDDDEARQLSRDYTVIEKGDRYLLIDLRTKTQ